jgi:hypothetical protein
MYIKCQALYEALHKEELFSSRSHHNKKAEGSRRMKFLGSDWMVQSLVSAKGLVL